MSLREVDISIVGYLRRNWHLHCDDRLCLACAGVSRAEDKPIYDPAGTTE